MKLSEDLKQSDPNWNLWKHMKQEHGLLLLDSELHDIFDLCDKRKREPKEFQPFKISNIKNHLKRRIAMTLMFIPLMFLSMFFLSGRYLLLFIWQILKIPFNLCISYRKYWSECRE